MASADCGEKVSKIDGNCTRAQSRSPAGRFVCRQTHLSSVIPATFHQPRRMLLAAGVAECGWPPAFDWGFMGSQHCTVRQSIGRRRKCLNNGGNDGMYNAIIGVQARYLLRNATHACPCPGQGKKQGTSSFHRPAALRSLAPLCAIPSQPLLIASPLDKPQRSRSVSACYCRCNHRHGYGGEHWTTVQTRPNG